jgi:hypothetical protein
VLALWLSLVSIRNGMEDWLGPLFAATVSLGFGFALLIEAAARRYGLIGIAFSLQGWLLTYSPVIVAGAVVGGVLSEDMAAGERTGEA